jgi:serine/threonine protein phosphatase PrpC
MKISSSYFSHRGRKSENEDAALPPIFHGEAWWTAIADGMGGQAGGQIASSTAIATVRANIEAGLPPSIPVLFNSITDKLKKIVSEQPELSKMGTTLSLLCIQNNLAHIGHVGDSRIYHLRNEGIITRTVEQTEVQELVERGVLTKANARRYSRRNILLSVLSAERDYRLLEDSFEILNGDRLVLTTDGVSSKVLAKELRDLSLECDNPKVFCDELLKKIELRKPVDDYTAICLDIADA